MLLSLHHVTFITIDLTRSRVFYQDLLGLQPDPQRPTMRFEGVWYDLAAGQQLHLMLLPNPETGLTRPAHGGRDRHVAFAVSDLDALIAKLQAAAIPYTLSQSGRHALFCRDPDDNALEFIRQEPVLCQALAKKVC
jgi:catechol 2,3-dioxygenase-like lactoylglutathione lyase family enzyme